jgi:hypothetical protein
MLCNILLQEVAQNADNATVSRTRGIGNDLDQRHTRGTARVRDITPLQFTVSAVFDALDCHSQLVPEASTRSALRWPSHSIAVHSPQVLLSQPHLFPASVFAERLPDFIEASSRMTKRLRTAVQEIGFATCGNGGERLGDKLGMGVSDATVLWSLFLFPLPEVGQVQVVGVDD